MSDKYDSHAKATAKALLLADVPLVLMAFKTIQPHNDAATDTKATDSDKQYVQPLANMLAGLLALATPWDSGKKKAVKI